MSIPKDPPVVGVEKSYIEWEAGIPTEEWGIPLTTGGWPEWPSCKVENVAAEDGEDWSTAPAVKIRVLFVRNLMEEEDWEKAREKPAEQFGKAANGREISGVEGNLCWGGG